ncbi:hypothetical protein BJY52DRAFT_1229314 [Lactarius psammicola]|nr:hypothetical protein BJY52DRAFT_1229314 [Lactarius psammicola]
MAADLIENPKVIQTFIHDIESAFLVLLWVATHYVTPNTQLQVLSSFVNSVFNPQVFGSSRGLVRAMFMRGEQELDHLIFQDNVPLTQLLCTLKELLSVRHMKHPERQHAHNINIKGIIDQALHEGAQGTKFPSNPTAADDTLQEAKLFQARLQNYKHRMSALQNHKVVTNLPTTPVKTRPWGMTKQELWHITRERIDEDSPDEGEEEEVRRMIADWVSDEDDDNAYVGRLVVT